MLKPQFVIGFFTDVAFNRGEFLKANKLVLRIKELNFCL